MIALAHMLPIVGLALGLLIFLILWGRGPWLPHPGLIFIPLQCVLVGGTAILLDPHNPIHNQYLWILSGGTTLYLVGLVAARTLWPTPRSLRVAWRQTPLIVTPIESTQNLIMFAILGVSILVSGLYFMAVGYNLFFESIRNFLLGGGAITDASTRRLATYSGDDYFAPGFVNQFKNILLPAITSVIVVRYFITKSALYRVAAIALIGASIISLLGTGQRGAFVTAAVAAGIYSVVSLPRPVARKVLMTLAVAGVTLMIAATLGLGRAADDSEGLDAAITGIWYRLVRENELSGLAYHEVFAGESPVGGAEWGNRLSNLLPGPGAKTSDNEVHAYLYGSDRGTAPATLWGSVWHNFAIPGLILFPFVLAFAHHSLYSGLIKGKKRDIRVVVFVGVSTAYGFWVIAGPDVLFNTGVVTLAFLHFLVHSLPRRLRNLLKPRCTQKASD